MQDICSLGMEYVCVGEPDLHVRAEHIYVYVNIYVCVYMSGTGASRLHLQLLTPKHKSMHLTKFSSQSRG